MEEEGQKHTQWYCLLFSPGKGQHGFCSRAANRHKFACNGCLKALPDAMWGGWELFKQRHQVLGDYEETSEQPDFFYDGRDGKEKSVSDPESWAVKEDGATTEALRAEVAGLKEQLRVRDAEVAALRIENSTLRMQAAPPPPPHQLPQQQQQQPALLDSSREGKKGYWGAMDSSGGSVSFEAEVGKGKGKTGSKNKNWENWESGGGKNQAEEVKGKTNWASYTDAEIEETGTITATQRVRALVARTQDPEGGVKGLRGSPYDRPPPSSSSGPQDKGKEKGVKGKGKGGIKGKLHYALPGKW